VTSTAPAGNAIDPATRKLIWVIIIGALAAAIATMIVARPLDIPGLILLSPGLTLIIYGLSAATGHGGFAAVRAWAPLAGGLALTVAFVIHALRRKSNPLINVRLLRVRSFAAATAVQFLAGLSVYGPLLLIALFYQDVQGKSAMAAGLLLTAAGTLAFAWAGREPASGCSPRRCSSAARGWRRSRSRSWRAPSATFRPRTCPTRAAPPESFSRSAGHSVPRSWP